MNSTYSYLLSMNAEFWQEMSDQLYTISPNLYAVVANRTFSSLKPSISPSNVALNPNPGTVLESACPDDSKTTPTC